MRKSAHTHEYAALRSELRGTRKAAGMSQRDLAAILKVPHSLIAKVESGERRMDLIEFCWFISACGGDPALVFTRLCRQFTPMHSKRGEKGGRSK